MNTTIIKLIVDKVLSDHQKLSEMNLPTELKNEYLETIELWSCINAKLIDYSLLDWHVWNELSECERRLKE